MRTALTSLTVVALLIVQVWVAATRGQELCISTDLLPAHECTDSHGHEHHGLLAPGGQHDSCGCCVHVTTPDDPQLVRAHSELDQHLLDSVIPALSAALLFTAADERTMDLSWGLPPPDPGAQAHVRALKVTRLLI